MARTLAAAAALVAACSFLVPERALAQQQMPGPPPLRFYAGGAGVNQVSAGGGGAGILGIQFYGDILPFLQWYWGGELVGVSVGSGFLAIADGDLGARFTPFPDWPLRPYVRANL